MAKDKPLDPQQQAFLANYLDPKSETWSNAYQSAVKAEYSEEYAKRILTDLPDWLSENLRKSSIVQQAIINLEEFLRDDENRNIKADMTKFALTKLNRDFNDKVDITSNGETLQVVVPQQVAKRFNIHGTDTNTSESDSK